MKGQSAIEYLTTYGWMLLVVAVAGGSIFSVVQNSSQIQSTSGLANADVRIDDFGVTGSSGLSLDLRNSAADMITVKSVNLSQSGNEVTASPGITIDVGGTETVSVDGIDRSQSSNTFDIVFTYDLGGLTDLTTAGTLTAPYRIVGTTVEKLQLSGDSISAMATNSTFVNSSQEICLGGECDSTTGSMDGYVNRSGDEMDGTLETDTIEDLSATCFGDLCPLETGDNEGYLGGDGKTMDGTLNVTEIKPYQTGNICVGTTC